MVHSNDVQSSAPHTGTPMASREAPGLTLLEGTPIQASQMLQVLPSSAKLANKQLKQSRKYIRITRTNAKP